MKQNNFKNKLNKLINVLLIFVFIIGFLILIYPFISQTYYKIDNNRHIHNFEHETAKLDKAHIEERIKLAKIYNSTLDVTKLYDPYTKEEKDRGRAYYAKMLEINDLIGHVEIPKINEDIPIYAGTSENVLQKGAGHLEGTSLPVGGLGSHSVITAHRGLPKIKLFTDLDKLEKGDIFYVHNIAGVLAYKVNQIKVVEPSNFNDVLVDSNKDYVTLLTCTPYAINSHRLLVRGERIYLDNLDTNIVLPQSKTFYTEYFKYVLYFFIFGFILFLYHFIRYLIVKRKYKKTLKNL